MEKYFWFFASFFLSFIFIALAAKTALSGEVLGVVVFPTQTPTPTLTLTPTLTRTPTPQPTATPTITSSPTPSPTPTPTNTPTPMPVSPFENYFDEFSSKYQVNKDLLKKIAYCESGGHPGAANGEYGGMFQYTVSTWQSTRQQMGADPNPDLRFGAKEAIETTAFKISKGGVNAWRNCSR